MSVPASGRGVGAFALAGKVGTPAAASLPPGMEPAGPTNRPARSGGGPIRPPGPPDGRSTPAGSPLAPGVALPPTHARRERRAGRMPERLPGPVRTNSRPQLRRGPSAFRIVASGQGDGTGRPLQTSATPDSPPACRDGKKRCPEFPAQIPVFSGPTPHCRNHQDVSPLLHLRIPT